MGSITSAFCTSFKAEMMQAAHCLAAQVTPTANTHTNQTIDTLSSAAGIVTGMGVSGSGVSANALVADWLGAASFRLSQATSSSLSTTMLTISGDVCDMALIIAAPTGVYGAATTNYSNVTGNSDETSGAGYSAGGFAWTAAQLTGIATSGTTAYGQFSVSPSWTSASFTTGGALTYNAALRFADSGNRALTVDSFGGSQTVTSGTFTATLPSNSNTTALMRLN